MGSVMDDRRKSAHKFILENHEAKSYLIDHLQAKFVPLLIWCELWSSRQKNPASIVVSWQFNSVKFSIYWDDKFSKLEKRYDSRTFWAKIAALVEQEIFTIDQKKFGQYFLSARDLALLQQINSFFNLVSLISVLFITGKENYLFHSNLVFAQGHVRMISFSSRPWYPPAFHLFFLVQNYYWYASFGRFSVDSFLVVEGY